MLRELHISNFAVIEDAAIDLRRGLNCFTGSTGAGKSLIIGAFEALLGLRPAADMLRDGADEGRISGVFELSDDQLINRINELADLDLDPTGDHEQLLITRKLFASGRTSFLINGRPATASMARDLGELLVDVHGQHDHQFLLKPANQLLMLDRFGGCEPLRQKFTDTFHRLRDLKHHRKELFASQTLRKQQLELYEFQADEIDAAEPTEGEYEEVESRHRLLSNLEKIKREAGTAHAALYESDGAIIERLQAVAAILRELGELDEQMSPIAQSVSDAVAGLQDTSFELNRYVSRMDLDQGELEEVADRLNTLHRLIQKYGDADGCIGGTLENVLAYRQQIGEEIQKLRDQSSDLESIDQQIEPLQNELTNLGEQLSEKRCATAKKLSPLVERQLVELGMAEAKFDVAFETVEPGESGCDVVEILVEPNPGQSPRPLRKIASGGELSRIMLGIKSIAAGHDRISVLIFDEVDANVGGRLGSVIGNKLRNLAAGHQVLCITHLPQIAAYADHHLKIAKTTAAGQTRTCVETLDDHKIRIDELAEMLTGKHATDTTRKQAGELLKLALASTDLKPKRRSPARKSTSKIQVTTDRKSRSTV